MGIGHLGRSGSMEGLLALEMGSSRSVWIRALQWSGNPYGNGYGVEMDGNGAQFVKILWIGLDLGRTVDLKR